MQCKRQIFICKLFEKLEISRNAHNLYDILQRTSSPLPPPRVLFENARLINGEKGEKKRKHCETSCSLSEAKQHGTIGNTVSRTRIFPFSLSFSSFSTLYLSCISRRVRVQFIVISPVPGTHEWKRSNFSWMSSDTGQPYTSSVYFETRGS